MKSVCTVPCCYHLFPLTDWDSEPKNMPKLSLRMCVWTFRPSWTFDKDKAPYFKMSDSKLSVPQPLNI